MGAASHREGEQRAKSHGEPLDDLHAHLLPTGEGLSASTLVRVTYVAVPPTIWWTSGNTIGCHPADPQDGGVAYADCGRCVGSR